MDASTRVSPHSNNEIGSFAPLSTGVIRFGPDIRYSFNSVILKMSKYSDDSCAIPNIRIFHSGTRFVITGPMYQYH